MKMTLASFALLGLLAGAVQGQPSVALNTSTPGPLAAGQQAVFALNVNPGDQPGNQLSLALLLDPHFLVQEVRGAGDTRNMARLWYEDAAGAQQHVDSDICIVQLENQPYQFSQGANGVWWIQLPAAIPVAGLSLAIQAEVLR